MSDELDVNLKKLNIEKGCMSLELEGGALQLFAEHFAYTFKDRGGKNYVEMTFWHEELGELVVTMQRKNGITPSGKVAKMKELIESGDIDAALAFGNL